MIETAEILTTHLKNLACCPASSESRLRYTLQALKGILRYSPILQGHVCLQDAGAALEPGKRPVKENWLWGRSQGVGVQLGRWLRTELKVTPEADP